MGGLQEPGEPYEPVTMFGTYSDPDYHKAVYKKKLRHLETFEHWIFDVVRK